MNGRVEVTVSYTNKWWYQINSYWCCLLPVWLMQCRPLSKTVRFNVLEHEPAVNQVRRWCNENEKSYWWSRLKWHLDSFVARKGKRLSQQGDQGVSCWTRKPRIRAIHEALVALEGSANTWCSSSSPFSSNISGFEREEAVPSVLRTPLYSKQLVPDLQ